MIAQSSARHYVVPAGKLASATDMQIPPTGWGCNACEGPPHSVILSLTHRGTKSSASWFLLLKLAYAELSPVFAGLLVLVDFPLFSVLLGLGEESTLGFDGCLPE